MYAHAAAIGVTTFLATAVELIEALTIVLAVGIARGWARALSAAACAVVILAAVVVVAGPRLSELVENHWIKLVVGAIALYVGARWLRKAMLRAAGRKAQRNEKAAFARERGALKRGDDTSAFITAFNGVLTEGIEVVAIVLALGSGSAVTFGAATGGALLALVTVIVAGAVVHRPLTRVPENLMKYAVGVMVTAFGVFWIGEGATLEWPARDISLFYLAFVVLIASLGTTAIVARAARGSDAPPSG